VLQMLWLQAVSTWYEEALAKAPKASSSYFGLSMDAADIERERLEARRDGFPAVAAWMARDPDSEMIITGSSMN